MTRGKHTANRPHASAKANTKAATPARPCQAARTGRHMVANAGYGQQAGVQNP